MWDQFSHWNCSPGGPGPLGKGQFWTPAPVVSGPPHCPLWCPLLCLRTSPPPWACLGHLCLARYAWGVPTAGQGCQVTCTHPRPRSKPLAMWRSLPSDLVMATRSPPTSSSPGVPVPRSPPVRGHREGCTQGSWSSQVGRTGSGVERTQRKPGQGVGAAARSPPLLPLPCLGAQTYSLLPGANLTLPPLQALNPFSSLTRFSWQRPSPSHLLTGQQPFKTSL